MQEFHTIYGQIAAPDCPDDLILRSLSSLGEWSYVEQQILARLVHTGDVLWDGGAFIGTFGIGVLQIATQAGRQPAQLIAIEPGADVRPSLAENLRRNVTCAHELLPFAIAASAGRLIPALPADRISDNRGALAYHAPDAGDRAYGSDSVESFTLAQMRALHGDYDILKLDLEGMELDALKGDFVHIAARKPVIWAECNEALTSLALLEGLVAAGYAPQYVAFPVFRRRNFRGLIDLPYPMAYEAALLAAPPDRLEQLDVTGLGEDIIVKPVVSSWDLRQALWSTPRWAEAAWTTASRPELIALLGRMSRSESLAAFLDDTPTA